LTYRVRNIGIAAALALLAAMLTFFYVSNYKRNVQQGQQLVDVYVASHDIPVGTSGSDAAGSLVDKKVARTAVVPGAISDPSQIKRLVATQEIFAGEQVSTKRFQPVTEEGIRGQLRGNLRAVSVPGDTNQLLVGTLQDGDFVDIVGNWSWPEGQQSHVSRTILRDIRVLKAPTQSAVSSHLGGPANQPYAAILALSDTQARTLYWMMKNGDWSFELRPVTKAADSAEGFSTSESILKTGLKGQVHP
jgi:Flp pilus assembly protein CpaB